MRLVKCNCTILQIIFDCFTDIPMVWGLIAQPKERELILYLPGTANEQNNLIYIPTSLKVGILLLLLSP